MRQDCVKEILSNLAKDVKEELRKNPFFLVTEHDLEGFIYSRLFMNKEIHEPFYDQQQRPNFKLHAEYPRYRKLYPEHQKYSGKSKGIGSNRMRYDIAILRQTLQDDDPLFRSKYFSERKVEIGFELKLHYDGNTKIVCDGFESEKGAFLTEDEDDSRIQKFPCDIGVIFHVNAAKERLASDSDQKEIEKGIKAIQKEVKIPLFVIYLESDCKNSEPLILLRSPLSW